MGSCRTLRDSATGGPSVMAHPSVCISDFEESPPTTPPAAAGSARSWSARSLSGRRCCSLARVHPALVAAAVLGPACVCAAVGVALRWLHGNHKDEHLHFLLGSAALLSLLLLGLLMFCRARGQRETLRGAREVQLEMGAVRPSARPVELVLGDIQWGNRIGGGKYGDVFKGMLVRTRETVAVKAMKKGQQVTRRHINDLVEEIEIMRQVADHGGHANIIGVRGYMKGDQPALVLELAVNGSLLERLQQMKKQAEVIKHDKIAEYCLQIAQGMRYIESCSVVHRDLAARNVLVMANDVLKISDFGLARGVHHGFLKTGGYQANIHRESNAWAWRWTAPEGLIEQKFTIKGDVWSFGIVITEICSRGDRPYHPDYSKADLAFVNWLDGGGRIKKAPEWPEDIYALARRCWKIEPKKRLSFKEIVATLRKRVGSRWWQWG